MDDPAAAQAAALSNAEPCYRRARPLPSDSTHMHRSDQQHLSDDLDPDGAALVTLLYTGTNTTIMTTSDGQKRST